MVLKAKDESNCVEEMNRVMELASGKGRRQEGAIIEGLRRRTREWELQVDDVATNLSSALVPA